MLTTALLMTVALSSQESPATGFFAEGRLSTINLPGDTGISAGGPSRVTMGLRGERASIGAGPWLQVLSIHENGENDNLWLTGLNVVGQFTLLKAANDKAEVYAALGLSLGAVFLTESEDTPDIDREGSPLVLGGQLSGGLRYFVDPHVGLSVELGQSYLSVPLDRNSNTEVRGSALQTYGSLGMMIVF